MPGIKVQEGHEEIDAGGRTRGNNKVCEDVVTEMKGGVRIAELSNDNV